jgi:hypothetical protein
MRRFLLAATCVASLSFVFTVPAHAITFGGSRVILPVVGRFPGAGGSQWRTDVFVSNHTANSGTAVLTFNVAGGAPLVRSVPLGPYTVLAFKDVVLNTFGLTNAAGDLEVTFPTFSEQGGEARARIYNTGNPVGEFGQSAPGLGTGLLRRQAFIYGLSGSAGNRVNVGVTNPNDVTLTATLSITDAVHNEVGFLTVTLAPHQNVQINDIVTRFGITPQDNLSAEWNTAELPIYGYASEVRNDSGDAVFTVGSSPNS